MKIRSSQSLFVCTASIFALALLATLSACNKDNGDPEPTQAEKVKEMLMSATTWTPTTITVDGVDVQNQLFAGFSIKFGEATLTTTGTTPVWLRQDTWSFKDENANVIIRGQDNKEVTISEISATQLKLTLEWDQTTTEGGRQGSLKGKHEFIFNK